MSQVGGGAVDAWGGGGRWCVAAGRGGAGVRPAPGATLVLAATQAICFQPYTHPPTPQVRLEDVVLGQYRSRTTRGTTLPGYLDDDTVPANRWVERWWQRRWVAGQAQPQLAAAGRTAARCTTCARLTPACRRAATPPSRPRPRSITPTFAACAVFVNNARWDGVPFLLKAGKVGWGMDWAGMTAGTPLLLPHHGCWACRRQHITPRLPQPPPTRVPWAPCRAGAAQPRG